MKLNKIAIAVGALVISGSAAAELSANIGATSNYVWRGVTQTDDDAAFSGGLDYAHESGFYVGTWASNVEFGDDTTAEVDLYGGFANEVSGVGYDVGVIYYAYPGGDDLNFTEIYGSLSFGPVTAGINYIVDSEVADTTVTKPSSMATSTTTSVPAIDIAPTWTVGGTVGYFDFDDDGVATTDTSYAHYQLDVGKSVGEYRRLHLLGLRPLTRKVGDDDAKVFVSWGKSFE